MAHDEYPLDPEVAIIDDSLARTWQDFRRAGSARAYVEHWLAYLEQDIAGISGAMVLSVDEAERYAPLAHWPQAYDIATLAGCAEQALAHPGEECVTPLSDGVALAFPVSVLGRVEALAVFALDAEHAARDARQRLRWSLAWLEVLFLRRLGPVPGDGREDAFFTALECVAAVVDKQDFQTSANALVGELAVALGAVRVSLALVDDGELRLHAISDTAVFGQQMNLVRLLEAAMNEALDQDATVAWPAPPDQAFMVTLAHDELAREAGSSQVLTVPLVAREQAVGALLVECEDDATLDAAARQLAEVVAALVAAPLVDRRAAERWLGGVVRERLLRQAERLLGPGYVGRKLLVGAMLALLVAASFVTGTYRVSGDAVLRGIEQRAVTAPIEGYVDTAPVRAGDRLRAGDTLLTLDQRDIRIERLKVVTERSQFEQQRRQAVAARERASVKVLDAQIEQATARLALLDEQIARTTVTMPFDGFVVSGDFSQALGTPVRRGDLLFEIAPSDRYRVIIDVDETQLDDVALEQSGTLRLNALPDEVFEIALTRITPITKARDGGNYFEVEGRILDANTRLRPGMRGIGKIAVDERNLVWIWTRALRAWLTLQWWRWVP